MPCDVDDSLQQRLINLFKSSSTYVSTSPQVLIITTNKSLVSLSDKFYSPYLAKNELLFNENISNICFGPCRHYFSKRERLFYFFAPIISL